MRQVGGHLVYNVLTQRKDNNISLGVRIIEEVGNYSLQCRLFHSLLNHMRSHFVSLFSGSLR